MHHQETVLILMLQALEYLDRKEQRSKLQEHSVVQTLTLAKRPSSSIFRVRGDNRSSTRFSYASDNSYRIDAVFTFDMEVMSSPAYRNAITSNFRRKLPQSGEHQDIARDRASNTIISTLEHIAEEAMTVVQSDEQAEAGLESAFPDGLPRLPQNMPLIPPLGRMSAVRREASKANRWPTRDQQRLEGVSLRQPDSLEYNYLP